MLNQVASIYSHSGYQKTRAQSKMTGKTAIPLQSRNINVPKQPAKSKPKLTQKTLKYFTSATTPSIDAPSIDIFNDTTSSMDISMSNPAFDKPSQQLDEKFRIDVYLYSIHKEMKTRPENYIKRQKEIKADMRTVLIDWLMEVSYSSATYMCSDVIPLAVNYLDRFLSKMGVPRSKFQLLGIVALMVASKMVDTIPPDTNMMSELTDHTYTSGNIKKMEHILLQQLDFDLYPPTPSMFFDYYLHLSNARPDIDETPQNSSAIIKRSYSSLFLHYLTEIITFDYRLSVSWLVSRTSFCSTILLRLIIKKILTQTAFVKGTFRTGHFNDFLSREVDLVEDVRQHGVYSDKLEMVVSSEFPLDKENSDPSRRNSILKSELVTCMIGIKTLWEGVVNQDSKRPDACLSVIEKYNREYIVKHFPDMPKLCKSCIPSVEDIKTCINDC